MRALVIASTVSLAAFALPAAPAIADDRSGPRAVFVEGDSGFGGDFGRRDRRRLRGGELVIVHDREYQGDTAWRSDSFNDWWHERPERSYPRWMQNNQQCQRKWWAGDSLRC